MGLRAEYIADERYQNASVLLREAEPSPKTAW